MKENSLSRKIISPFLPLYRKFRDGYYAKIGKKDPEELAAILFKKCHGYRMDLENPSDIDEKINWLKFNTNTDKWSELTDKYLARQYVENKGLGHTLNTIYGVYEKSEDINFETLPESFVIKLTNGGGGKYVKLVQNKGNLNITYLRKELNEWLKYPFGLISAEPHYLKIKPRILIEKYLNSDLKDENSLVDYKFNCYNGKAYSVFLCSDRIKEKVNYSIYDLNWNLQPEKITAHYRTHKIYPQPVSFDKMLAYSEILAKEFPLIRVDWYEINGEPVFSEMTFTPGAGFQTYYTPEYRQELGAQLVLPGKNVL
ncbi:hypothetical protein DMB45_09380 [Sanguibacteroides justesenii]|nr:hypothetical protein DMB45_09380 [Sanguibacteroides justesenii]